MLVSEMFLSIQGEGVHAGRRAVFLRLALCNLRCTYCDTKYAFKGESKRVEDVLRELEPLLQGCNLLVITGGEPLLQQRSLVRVLSALKPTGIEVEVETNGTRPPIPDLQKYVDLWIVSPKLSSSGEAIQRRRNPDTLSLFISLNSIFKFVVSGEGDVVEAIRDFIEPFSIPAERVWLMPCAATKEELEKRCKEVALLALRYGFNYSDRLQLRVGLR